MENQLEINTKIANDGMSASLLLPAAFDRATLTPETCESALRAENIKIDAETKARIAGYIHSAQTADPGIYEAVIAKGIEPTEGIDGAVEWKANEQQVKDQPKDLPDPPEGSTENDNQIYYEQSSFTFVKKDQVLGKITPETPGKDGYDVLGNALVADEAKPADFADQRAGQHVGLA